MRYLASLVFALMLCPASAVGAINTIALSGSTAPGISDAELYSFGLPSLNADGDAVLTATLELGPGSVNSANDGAVYKINQGSWSLVSREGASAPGISGATFSHFSSVAIDDAGHMLLRGEMSQTGSITTGNNQGLWRYSSSGSLLARTGSTGVPGMASSNTFSSLPLEESLLSADGRAVFLTQLTWSSGITFNNDRGIWSYDGTSGALISREGSTIAPDTGMGTFSIFSEPVINDNNQIAFSGVLNLGGNINTTNRQGIWKYNQGVGELIARTGQDVPGVSNVSFQALSRPSINNVDQVAFRGTITSGETQGVWRYTENQGELIALAGVSDAPGAPDALFAGFGSPFLSDTGDMFFRATLQNGTGGVNTSNQTGLWKMGQSQNALLFRTGSVGVPGLPAAHFADFTTMAVNEVGSLVVSATLTNGIAGITTENDEGIWFADAEGNKSLIAREGDLLAGKTISSLSFTGNSSGSDGQRTGFNSLDQLIFRATFTDGDSGIFLYSPSTTATFLGADFNEDGYVDGTDLAMWQNAFGVSNLGDSDGDGDSDGVDFLTWQRQFTGPPAHVLQVAVPEPNVCCLLAIACFFSYCRKARQIARG